MQVDPKSGQPKTQRTDANVDTVRTLVRSNRRLGVRVIAEELDTNRQTVRHIVKEDLGMRKISAKMVRQILTHDQEQRWLHFSLIFYMVVCFFDHKGIVHCKFIAQGQTVNQQCYLEVLTRLRESFRRKRPGIWPDM